MRDEGGGVIYEGESVSDEEGEVREVTTEVCGMKTER